MAGNTRAGDTSCSPQPCAGHTIHYGPEDRIWVVNTRQISSDVEKINLSLDQLAISRLDFNGHEECSSVDHLLSALSGSRQIVYYVHGNRFEHHEAVGRGLLVHQRTRKFSNQPHPIDWVIWSWPSSKEGVLIWDARLKAKRADVQSFYLGQLLQRQADWHVPTTAIGYSFGCSIISGSLHLAAGGRLAGRSLPGQPVKNLNVRAGFVAAAIGNQWLSSGGRHAQATQNMDRLTLLFNRSDVALKRYWWIEKVHSTMPLGLTGPKRFSRRADGTPLPVWAADCRRTVGRRHKELNYYQRACQAGQQMAHLIDEGLPTR